MARLLAERTGRRRKGSVGRDWSSKKLFGARLRPWIHGTSSETSVWLVIAHSRGGVLAIHNQRNPSVRHGESGG